jgi:hypothetical protein
MTVSERFNQLLENLKLTSSQVADGQTKHRGVRLCLNKYYYNMASETTNSFLVGSWGKNTEIRPPRDVDLMFELPYHVYERFQQRPGNKQSQLLQEVKQVLQTSYPSTSLRGDGQVVIIPFVSYAVEVAPAFAQFNAQYYICDTNDGGRYKTVDPKAEILHVKSSNEATNGNTRNLIRMMKCWQAACNVPLKSFWIELLMCSFLESSPYRDKSTVYYDYLTRDFFKYLVGRSGGYLSVPGIPEIIAIGDSWKSKAESAASRAEKATGHEAAAEPYSAGLEWQKIFGTDVPIG